MCCRLLTSRFYLACYYLHGSAIVSNKLKLPVSVDIELKQIISQCKPEWLCLVNRRLEKGYFMSKTTYTSFVGAWGIRCYEVDEKSFLYFLYISYPGFYDFFTEDSVKWKNSNRSWLQGSTVFTFFQRGDSDGFRLFIVNGNFLCRDRFTD